MNRAVALGFAKQFVGARGVAGVASVVAIAFAATHALVAFDAHALFVHDDSYITLRYARNLTQGLGLVWNPGERVEGYTSFLAVIGIAALHGLGLDYPSGAFALNLVGYALLVLALLCHGLAVQARAFSRFPLALLPALLVATHVPTIIWVQGRLEGPLYAGLAALALFLNLRLIESPTDLRRQVPAAISLGLLPLVRPDGAMFGLVSAIFVAVACYRQQGNRLRPYLRFCAMALLLPVFHLAFRRIYYGEWVPNTVIAKGTGLPIALLLANGSNYFASFSAARPYLPLLAALALPVALFARGRFLPVVYLATSAAGYLLMIVRVGGDQMPAHRLFLPVVPALAMLVGEGLRGLAEVGRARERTRFAASALAVALLVGLVPGPSYPEARRPNTAAFLGTGVGEFLARTYRPGTLVALNNAGSTPYFAPALRFVDMLGLNDARIARRSVDHVSLARQNWPGHAKGDGAYVLAREPHVIIVGPASGTAGSPWFLSDMEIVQSPEFRRHYVERRGVLDFRGRPGVRLVPGVHDDRAQIIYYERLPSAAAPEESRY